MNGSILKSNGTYRHISTIKPGDYVINMKGKPVKVVKNVQVKHKRRTELIKYNHTNHYDSLWSMPGKQVLLWNEHGLDHCMWQDVLKLFEGGKISIQPSVVVPAEIDWDMPETFVHNFGKYELKPSHALGYLFGTFLRVGGINKYRGTTFDCASQSTLIKERIVKFGEDVFGVPPMWIELSNQEHDLSELVYKDDDIYDIFDNFVMNDNSTTFPLLFRCKNKLYLKGIAEGLSLTQYVPYSIMAMETKYITMNGLLKRFQRTWNENNYFLAKVTIDICAMKEDVSCWELDVDCTTKSFVINNMVVKN